MEELADKKILVVLTGGTIGSTIDGTTIDIKGDSKYRLIRAYEHLKGILANKIFDIVNPYDILSENIVPATWDKLITFLGDIDYKAYSGVIITHGTDTCANTAALLGMLYDEVLDVPMILVSSNYAIGEIGSNGLNNLSGAVNFIRQRGSFRDKDEYNKVFGVYENNKGILEVIRGRQMVEADTCTDQFTSFGGEAFGVMSDGYFIKNVNYTERCALKLYGNMTGDDSSVSSVKEASDISFSRKVMCIKSYPGLDYSLINITSLNDVSAVVVYGYHSATFCTNEEKGAERYSFTQFIRRCNEEGINCYAAGFKPDTVNHYASANKLEEVKYTKIYDVSMEAAYAYVLIKENQ